MTPQEEIRFRQMMANQMSARQPMLRDQMPYMDPNPLRALPIATPAPQNPLEEIARRRGLIPPDPYARGLRPPTDAERERFDATNPDMPLNDLALARLEAERLARLEAERPFNPGSTRFPDNPYYYTGGTPLSPMGGEVATAPEPEEYDGFVDSGTGQRGYLDFQYMPTPMDQAAPVAMASTAYNAPPVANTAYMPSRRTVPVDTTYRPPAQANTTYMPSSAPTYGMSSTPSYGMSNAQTTTPTYTGPSFSPNQAGKYKVDGPRLKNTGGLFNDLNAFFGRPQT